MKDVRPFPCHLSYSIEHLIIDPELFRIDLDSIARKFFFKLLKSFNAVMDGFVIISGPQQSHLMFSTKN